MKWSRLNHQMIIFFKSFLVESKPPLLKKAEKIVLNNNSETDSKNNRPVSKSYGSNINSFNNDDNYKEFPFKDSLKLIKNNKAMVSKSEDLSRVICLNF
jgi:hypothetical protein